MHNMAALRPTQGCFVCITRLLCVRHRTALPPNRPTQVVRALPCTARPQVVARRKFAVWLSLLGLGGAPLSPHFRLSHLALQFPVANNAFPMSC
jgi:hypothetical protein